MVAYARAFVVCVANLHPTHGLESVTALLETGRSTLGMSSLSGLEEQLFVLQLLADPARMQFVVE